MTKDECRMTKEMKRFENKVIRYIVISLHRIYDSTVQRFNDVTWRSHSLLVICLTLASTCMSAEPTPSAKDILDSVRMLESRQQIDLQGQLRQDDIVIPFRLMQNGPLIRYTFTNPDETLELRLGENGSRLELVSDA